MNNDPILTTALQIHSVEARHTAQIGDLRGQKDCITGNQDMPAAVFTGDESVKHVEVSALVPGVPYENAAEAWDEPLSKGDVLKIVMPLLA